MSFAYLQTATGTLPCLSLRLVRDLQGPWTCEAEVDLGADAAPVEGNACSLVIEGRTFKGTVRHAPTQLGGRCRVSLVAGAGGWASTIALPAYRDVHAKIIYQGLFAAAGETLAASPPDVVLGYWHAARGDAGPALTALCGYLGLTWRHLDSGAVWIGEEAWLPALSVGLPPREIGETSLTFDVLGVLLEPGTTYEGRRIERVVYTLTEEGAFTATLSFVRGGSSSTTARAFAQAVRAALPELEYLARWGARVVAQDALGRLELAPDDETQPGTPPAPVLYGLPGCRAVVDAGARVGLTFADADQSKPRAMGWEQATPARELHLDASDLIALAGGSKGVVRVDDRGSAGTVDVVPGGTGIRITNAAGDVWVCPITFLGGAVSVGPSVPPGPFPLITKATQGSFIVKAGG